MSTNGSEPGSSFEQRLHAARARQGLEKPPAANAKGDLSGSGKAMRAGMELVAAEVVAGAIGFGLDRWLHTMPLFLIIFILIGGAAGVRNVWRLSAPPSGTPPDSGKG